jgi:hypothetical protein
MKTEQEILDLKNSYYSYKYCLRNQDAANIKAHQDIIIQNSIECGFHYYLFVFARDIMSSDKQLLSEIVLASGRLNFIKSFYKYIKFDKSKYETLMLFI